MRHMLFYFTKKRLSRLCNAINVVFIYNFSFRPKCTNSFNDKTPSINDKDLKESHFKLETDNKEWINFGKSTFNLRSK